MIKRLVVMLIILLMSVACSTSPRVSLEGTQWQLQRMNGQPVPTGMNVTMEFTADTFGGTGFCNSYGGNYRLEGNTIVVDQTVMTMMACIGDNRDQLEQTHIAALGVVATYQVDGDTLTLFDATNVARLQFVRTNT